MAGKWYDIGLVLICVNLFIYIGSAQLGYAVVSTEGDLLSNYIVGELNKSSFTQEASAVTFGVNETTMAAPERSTVATVGTYLEVLNALDVAFDFVLTIFNIAFAPLVLFQIEGIPFIIAFIIGVPLTILFWLSLIQFIRGAS